MRGAAFAIGCLLVSLPSEALAQESAIRAKEPEPDVWRQGPLGSQVTRLADRYSKLGQVTRLRPRLLEQRQSHSIVLPRALTAGGNESCVTVAALGTPNLSFLLLFQNSAEEPARRAWPVPSAAGVAEVTRCGARKSLLRNLALRLRSRRGVVEFVVLRSEHPPPPISELVPSRNAGPSLPSPQVGRRPWLAPLAQRIAQLERYNRRGGAARLQRSGLSANDSGRGSAVVHLDPGCHRLELLAPTHQDSPPDLDARLFTLTRGNQLVEDTEHSAQVRLEHCVGRPERVRVDFSGARPKTEVTLLHSTWSLPAAFPVAWGPLSRARLAQAAWLDDLTQFRQTPVFSSLGVRGTTKIALPTAPSGCYIAVMAPIRGDVSSIALGVAVGPRSGQTHALAGAGVTLSFCSDGDERADLEVQALGSSLAWILGVWSVGGYAQ